MRSDYNLTHISFAASSDELFSSVHVDMYVVNSQRILDSFIQGISTFQLINVNFPRL